MLAVGLPTLWDLQWMTQLEDWKKGPPTSLKIWLNTLGEMGSSGQLIGAFAFANPSYPLLR
ncbi:MAG: hypothetical protein R2822_10575 [Spirosomataceae bacterium]